MSFEARYHSTCGTCDETITPGQQARHDEAGCVVHVKCPEPVDQDAPQRNEKRCTSCNMTHAGECW